MWAAELPVARLLLLHSFYIFELSILLLNDFYNKDRSLRCISGTR